MPKQIKKRKEKNHFNPKSNVKKEIEKAKLHHKCGRGALADTSKRAFLLLCMNKKACKRVSSLSPRAGRSFGGGWRVIAPLGHGKNTSEEKSLVALLFYYTKHGNGRVREIRLWWICVHERLLTKAKQKCCAMGPGLTNKNMKHYVLWIFRRYCTTRGTRDCRASEAFVKWIR